MEATAAATTASSSQQSSSSDNTGDRGHQAASQILRYIPGHRILLCTVCGFCVVPSQLKTHLSKHHPEIQSTKRRILLQQVTELQDLAQTVDAVIFPRQEEAPIPGISVQKGCFQCDTCSWLSATLAGMQEHCRKTHNWQSSKGRGGSPQKKGAPDRSQVWTDGHYCQQFFKAPGWKRLVKVQPGSQDSQDATRLEEAGNALLQQIQTTRRQARDQRVVTLLSTRTQANPWMTHTSWDSHLYGFQRSDLKESLYPASPGSPASPSSLGQPQHESNTEAALERACQATERLFQKAMSICDPCIIPRAALLFVNRKEAGSGSNETPFYSRHSLDTLRKYTTVWTKTLRYLWHSQGWESRPCYQFTQDQARAFTEMQLLAKHSPAACPKSQRAQQKSDLEWAVAIFWGSMLDHQLLDSEFESGLISALAVHGLDTDSNGWAEAKLCTPKLSAIVTFSRALVVYIAWYIRQMDIREGVGSGLTEAEAQHNARGIFPQVQEMVRKFMCLVSLDGKPTPLDRILHMRTFGMRIAFITKSEARVSWKGNHNEVSIDQVHFSMGELRTVVHGLHEACRDRLVKQLMFLEGEELLPPLHLKSLFDNPAELVEGWSFLQDTRNVEAFQVVERESWLWKRMVGEENIRSQLLRGSHQEGTTSDQNLSFNMVRVEEYFRAVRQFKEELIVLCHLTAGAPARGPELISVMHENGQDSRAQRGIFIDDGQVEMVIPYHKGYSLSQRVKIIHRYLPQEVGELVVFYLWLVEPFLQHLQQLTTGQVEFSSHLWEPEPESTDRPDPGEAYTWEDSDNNDGDKTEGLSECEGEDASEREGEDSPVRPSQPQPKPTLQSRTPQREPLNVDGFWSTNRLKRVMKRECRSRIGVAFSAAQWRQVYPAIQRVHMSSPEGRELLDHLYNAKQMASQQTQSGHSLETEDSVYGISVTENPFSTFTQQRQFRHLSQMWHQFLHFPSASQGPRHSLQDTHQIQETWERAQAARWCRLRKVDLLSKLQQMTKPDAQFRGSQLKALQAIMARESRVVLVMQTGGGKSLMYMLPAACSPEGLTIVVVPLNSLLADQVKRCKQAGLRVAHWGEARAVRLAQVVLVTPESAATKAFGRFLQEKTSVGLLERVVIDECHIVLESTQGWRPKIQELSQLVEESCQLVYLTATLPPRDEKAFFQCTGLDEKNVMLLRDSTTRANIAYSVLEYPKPELDQVV